jgi:hypothetical protein
VVVFLAGVRDSVLQSFQTGSGTHQPPTQWVLGSIFPGIKWLGCEADHSAPSSAEVQNVWSYTSAPPYVLMSCTGTAPIQI